MAENERNIIGRKKAVKKSSRKRKNKIITDSEDLPSPPPDPWTPSECEPHQNSNQMISISSQNFGDGEEADMTEEYSENADRGSLSGNIKVSKITKSSNSRSSRHLDEEEDLMAYLVSLESKVSPFESQFPSACPSRNSAASTMAVSECLINEDVFNHLDRLYVCIEEILDLRNRSTKLFKRVRDLERIEAQRRADLEATKIIQHDEIDDNEEFEADARFAESILDAILCNQQPRNVRSPSSSRRRSRSLVPMEQSIPPRGTNLKNDFEKKLPYQIDTGGPKISKWTRVKAAFKWEKAYINESESVMIGDSVTTPSTPTSKYLKIPDVLNNWSSGEGSGPSTPVGRISSASSSNEDVYDGTRRSFQTRSERQSLRVREGRKKSDPHIRSQSLDNEVSEKETNQQNCVNESIPGTPIIRVTTEYDKCGERSVESCSPTSPAQSPSTSARNIETIKVKTNTRKTSKNLTITIPSNDDLKTSSSPESISPLPSSANLDSDESSSQKGRIRQRIFGEYKRQFSLMEEPTSPIKKMQRQDSKWNKVRRAFLTGTAFSVPPSPVKILTRQSFPDGTGRVPKARSCSGSVEDLSKSMMSHSNMLQSDTHRDYQALRENLGAEFHRKLIEWEKIKGAQNRNCAQNANARNDSNCSSSREGLPISEDRLTPEFKKKLQEWKRAKKDSRRASGFIEQQRNISRRRLTDWQIWRLPTRFENKSESRNVDKETTGYRGSIGSVGSVTSVDSEPKSYHCEDSMKQMDVLRKFNEMTTRRCGTPDRRRSSTFSTQAEAVDDTEFFALHRIIPKSKIERENDSDRNTKEIWRFNKEVNDNEKNKNEVLVHTPVGCYRFEGISQEFTRKLYAWEKHRGISPQSSTLRLLGAGYAEFAERRRDPSISTTDVDNSSNQTIPLETTRRSKSMNSLCEGRNTGEDTSLRRSTSLRSLNRQMEKFDNDCTGIVPTSTEIQQSEDTVLDDSEPEAMIVDIEDVIEETASPLVRVQPHQTPVYSVATIETTSIAVPLGTVSSSHEPSPVILVEAEERPTPETLRIRDQKIWSIEDDTDTGESNQSPNVIRLDQTDDPLDADSGVIINSINRNILMKIPELKNENQDIMGFVDPNAITITQQCENPGGIFELEEVQSLDLSSEYQDELECRNHDNRPIQDEIEEDLEDDSLQYRHGMSRRSTLDAISRSSQGSPHLEPVQHRATWQLWRNWETEESLNSIRASTVGTSNNYKWNIHHFHDPPTTKFEEVTTPIHHQRLDENSKAILIQNVEYNSIREQSLNKRFDYLSPTATLQLRTCSEPTVKTTSLTVSGSQETRHYKKILINEETLNNIIVPTNTEMSKSITNEQFDGEEIEDQRKSPSGSSTSSNHDLDKIEQKSESQNVILETKRIIFTPFNREDAIKHDTQIEDSRRSTLTPESRSDNENESRSTSPKDISISFNIPMPRRHSKNINVVEEDGSVKENSIEHLSSSSTAESSHDNDDKLSADLMHKLEVLSNALASRRNSSNSLSETPSRRNTISSSNLSDFPQRHTIICTTENEFPMILDNKSEITASKFDDNGMVSSVSIQTPIPHSMELPSEQPDIISHHAPNFIGSNQASCSKDFSSHYRPHYDEFMESRSLPHIQHSSCVEFQSLPCMEEIESEDRFDTSSSSYSRDRALKLKKAKEGFLSRWGGPLCPTASANQNDSGYNEHENSPSSISSSNSSTSTIRIDLVKSASAGMINVDVDDMDRLTTTDRGCESLPRCASKRRSDVGIVRSSNRNSTVGSLSRIVSKLNLVRFLRGKDNQNSDMSTVSTLCRQSLSMSVQSELEN